MTMLRTPAHWNLRVGKGTHRKTLTDFVGESAGRDVSGDPLVKLFEALHQAQGIQFATPEYDLAPLVDNIAAKAGQYSDSYLLKLVRDTVVFYFVDVAHEFLGEELRTLQLQGLGNTDWRNEKLSLLSVQEAVNAVFVKQLSIWNEKLKEIDQHKRDAPRAKATEEEQEEWKLKLEELQAEFKQIQADMFRIRIMETTSRGLHTLVGSNEHEVLLANINVYAEILRFHRPVYDNAWKGVSTLLYPY